MNLDVLIISLEDVLVVKEIQDVSRFYISLEDDLMRIFGSERIQGVVEKLGLQDDEAIESKMVKWSYRKCSKES